MEIHALIDPRLAGSGNILTIDETKSLTEYSLVDGTRAFTGVVGGIAPTSAAHLVTKEYVDVSVAGLHFDMFFDNLDSGINDPVSANDYYSLQDMDTGAAVTILTGDPLGQGDDQEVVSYISSANLPFVEIQPGLVNVHLHARKNNTGQKDSIIFCELYHRADDATETPMATTEDSTDLTNSVREYDLHGNVPSSVAFVSTDRLLLKIRADVQSSGGANAEIEITQEGAFDSRVSSLVDTDVLSSLFLRLDGATATTGVITLGNALYFTQVDGNEKIDSDDDAHMDYHATTSHDFNIGGTEQVEIVDGAILPTTDNDIDLGDTTHEFKDLWIDGTANIDSLIADTADINGGTVDGITSLTVANNVDIGNYNIRALSSTFDSLTLGSVVFASTNGLLIDDNSNLFWDNTNKRLGIGTITNMLAPLNITGDTDNIGDRHEGLWMRVKAGAYIVQLNVRGPRLEIGGGASLDTTPAMSINYLTGKVGIGTTSKLSKLTVKQSADESDIGGTTTASSATTITGSDTTFTTDLGVGDRISLSSAASIYATVTAIASDTSLTVDTALGDGSSQTINAKHSLLRLDDASDSVKLIVSDQGNVGIGTTAPDYILDINAGEIDDDNYDGLRIIDTGWDATSHPMLEFYNSHASFSGPLARIYGEIGSGGTNSKLYFAVADSSKNLQDRMTLDKDGILGVDAITITGNLSVALTGTVAANNGSNAIVGTGTNFDNGEITVGDAIKIESDVDAGYEIFTVATITDDTHLTVDSNYAGSNDTGLDAWSDPDLFTIDNGDSTNLLTVDKDGNLVVVGGIDNTVIGGSTPAAGTFASPLKVQNTGSGSFFLVDRTDGKVMNIQAAGTGCTIDYDDTGLLLIRKADKDEIRAASGAGAVTVATFDSDGNLVVVGGIDNTVIGGSIPVAGTFTDLTANDDVIVGENIVHQGDADTYIGFNTDHIQLIAGGATFVTAVQLKGDNYMGFFGAASAMQQNHIVDADGQLADITTKFNTLLSDLEGYGLLKTS